MRTANRQPQPAPPNAGNNATTTAMTPPTSSSSSSMSSNVVVQQQQTQQQQSQKQRTTQNIGNSNTTTSNGKANNNNFQAAQQQQRLANGGGNVGGGAGPAKKLLMTGGPQSASASRMLAGYELSQELTTKLEQILENKYGGRERAHTAAIKIQQAYRQFKLRQHYQRVMGGGGAQPKQQPRTSQSHNQQQDQQQSPKRTLHDALFSISAGTPTLRTRFPHRTPSQQQQQQPTLRFQPTTSLSSQLRVARQQPLDNNSNNSSSAQSTTAQRMINFHEQQADQQQQHLDKQQQQEWPRGKPPAAMQRQQQSQQQKQVQQRQPWRDTKELEQYRQQQQQEEELNQQQQQRRPYLEMMSPRLCQRRIPATPSSTTQIPSKNTVFSAYRQPPQNQHPSSMMGMGQFHPDLFYQQQEQPQQRQQQHFFVGSTSTILVDDHQQEAINNKSMGSANNSSSSSGYHRSQSPAMHGGGGGLQVIQLQSSPRRAGSPLNNNNQMLLLATGCSSSAASSPIRSAVQSPNASPMRHPQPPPPLGDHHSVSAGGAKRSVWVPRQYVCGSSPSMHQQQIQQRQLAAALLQQQQQQHPSSGRTTTLQLMAVNNSGGHHQQEMQQHPPPRTPLVARSASSVASYGGGYQTSSLPRTNQLLMLQQQQQQQQTSPTPNGDILPIQHHEHQQQHIHAGIGIGIGAAATGTATAAATAAQQQQTTTITTTSSSTTSAAAANLAIGGIGSGGAAAAAALGPAAAGLMQQQQHVRVEWTEQQRRRLYRIALNFFNKKPDRGVQLLVRWGFVEEGSPRALARLFKERRGLSKQMIGEYLGTLKCAFHAAVLDHFIAEIPMYDMELDKALRQLLMHFRLPGEAQKIDHIIQAFARRYVACNPHRLSPTDTPDTIYILAFAIIMLNTDLHTPSLRDSRRMKLDEFIKNLGRVEEGRNLDKQMLTGIYERVKEFEFRAGTDHVTQVLKVDQSIVSKEKPKLVEPHRRLICYCRLHQIKDANKKQSTSAHQREIFLFNDLLLVCKAVGGRKRSSSSKTGSSSIGQYELRYWSPLIGLQVEQFQSPLYPNGMMISFPDGQVHLYNAKNQEDRYRFVADIRESVEESTEMEQWRIQLEVERQQQHQSQQHKHMVGARLAEHGSAGFLPQQQQPSHHQRHLRQLNGTPAGANANGGLLYQQHHNNNTSIGSSTASGGTTTVATNDSLQRDSGLPDMDCHTSVGRSHSTASNASNASSSAPGSSAGGHSPSPTANFT